MNNAERSPGRTVRVLLSPILYHGYRIFIAGLFLYAGVTKLADMAGFAQTIAAYRILPDPLVPCAAMGLPVVEILAGGGALFNRRWAILGLTGIMILFLGVLSYGVAMGLNIDCGCFGTEANTAPKQADSTPMLDVPGLNGGDSGGTVVQIEPPPESNTGDETCDQKDAGSKSLKIALVRDFFLFLGVLYLVAWPDLRRRYGLVKPSNVQGPTSNR
jgi:uncharacterized membrane protein YphA (DoxX/SURF4 family)